MTTMHGFGRGGQTTSQHRNNGALNSTTIAYGQEYDQSSVKNTNDSISSDYFGNIKTAPYVYDHYSVYNTNGSLPQDYYGDETAYLDDDDANALPMEYKDFIYEAFGFERPIYLYIWEILVIVTVLVNLVVIWVLLQKRMRSVTNLILVAIAISDSMTGLVTLPTYVMVYNSLQTADDEGVEYDGNSTYDYSYMYDNYEYMYENITNDVESRDAYILSKPLCEAFMISKFFLSKLFHTISIWLTVFLGIQRYISVAYPFKTKTWFTSKNTIKMCVVIALAAPVLHLYHLLDEKTVDGFCTWILNDRATAHIWTTLLLRHLIPCTILSVTTVLFVIQLKRNSFAGSEAREEGNRRVSKIVIVIVSLFLIPEIPYGLFLLYLNIVRHMDDSTLVDLKRNRAAHAIYELLLVLTCHLNFYVYTLFNKRFRRQLKRTFTCMFSKGRFKFQLSSRQSNFRTRTTFAGSKSSESLSQTRGNKSLNRSSDTDSRATEMRTLNTPSDNDINGKEMKPPNTQSDTDRIQTEMK